MGAIKEYRKAFQEGDVDLYWPANIADQYDYLELEIVSFMQRDILKRDEAARGGISTAPQPAASQGAEQIGAAAGNNGPLSQTRTSTINLVPKGKILLPIPDNLSYTDGPQWSDQSVGAIGRFGAQAVAELTQNQNADQATKALQAAAAAGKIDVVKGLLNKIGVDPNALAQNVAGKIANPYLQQVFQGIGLRQFDFNWKLVPRNKREQRSIKNIILQLRKNALPGFSQNFSDLSELDSVGNLISLDLTSETEAGAGLFAGKQNVDRWLTLPNIFNLKWKHTGGEIDSLPKLKQCVCKNISVQYTPNGVWATHLADGEPEPVGYNLTMSFGEMSIVTFEDVLKGF